MAIEIATERVPLATDQDGVVRVGGTRVTLDTVVHAFREGATAEDIAQRYPSVRLSDVYSVLGYYLHRQDEIDGYLRSRSAEMERSQAANEARADPVGIRDRLQARSRRKM